MARVDSIYQHTYISVSSYILSSLQILLLGKALDAYSPHTNEYKISANEWDIQKEEESAETYLENNSCGL